MAFSPDPICPQCGAKLAIGLESAVCPQGHVYPVLLGSILDLVPTEAKDKGVVEQLLSAFHSCSYSELSEISFGNAGEIPEVVLETYRSYSAMAIERNGRMTHMFRSQAANHYALNGTRAAFEIGCGRGGNLLVLSKVYQHVVGLDPVLASLIRAKKFLDEHGVTNAILIHGYGQNIPYAAGSFDYVTAVNVLEHVLDVDNVVAETKRILCPGGIFVADSRNRLDILFPEPHVRLRFVGLLPRRWAKKYVRWRRGMDYSNTQLLSYLDLSRVLKRHFGSRHKILCARVSAYGYPTTLDAWVDRLDRLPLVSQLMRLVFPSYLVVAQKQETAAK